MTKKEQEYWDTNRLTVYPSCKICNTQITNFGRQYNIDTKKREYRYPLYCSSKCRANDKDVINKMKNCESVWYKLMSNISTKEELLEFLNNNLYDTLGEINANVTSSLPPNIKYILDLQVNIHSTNYTEKLYWFINDLTEYPKSCKECGSPITFFKNWSYDCRKDFCSNKCKGNNLKAIIIANTDYKSASKKRLKTVKDKYGCINVMHDTSIMDTCMSNQYKWKEYILPSGKVIKVQGYENKALDELLQTYNEMDIITSRKDIPEIWYELDNKIHRYYPDIYIPKDNLIIEVKSEYTLKANKYVNELKFNSVKDNNYNFKLMVY